MSKCVMVLGVPRSGTSAIAGVLHKVGVNMGEGYLQPGNHSNRAGYYEDLRWQKLNKQITGDKYAHAQPEEISPQAQKAYRELAEECARAPLWGVKDPRLCFTAHFIARELGALGVDLEYVVITRAPLASAESLVTHSQTNYKGRYRMHLDVAMGIRDVWEIGLQKQLAAVEVPRHVVRYEQLLAHPENTVRRLARFVYAGTGARPPARLVAAAVAHVDPRLKHHG